jgi:hypothetical protein
MGKLAGGKYSALWSGDWSGYPSQSEADLALCIQIAFYVPDAARIEAIFARSGLAREKWTQREDYRRTTIACALARQSGCYRRPAKADGNRLVSTVVWEYKEAGKGEGKLSWRCVAPGAAIGLKGDMSEYVFFVPKSLARFAERADGGDGMLLTVPKWLMEKCASWAIADKQARREYARSKA